MSQRARWRSPMGAPQSGQLGDHDAKKWRKACIAYFGLPSGATTPAARINVACLGFSFCDNALVLLTHKKRPGVGGPERERQKRKCLDARGRSRQVRVVTMRGATRSNDLARRCDEMTTAFRFANISGHVHHALSVRKGRASPPAALASSCPTEPIHSARCGFPRRPKQ